MKQKIFLTSALAMGFVAPAFAEPSNTGTFPNDGYMQEDYTYTNAATADNMDSVYEGSVNAIAEYTEIPYSAEEGFYLTGVDDNNDAITAECTSGNFCPGVASTTYENNAFGNTGLQSCSTATSGAYTLSDAGASSSDQCYRTCNGNVSILHATGVTGNDYSDGTNTCAPTGCDNGYHVKPATPDLMTVIGASEAGADYVATNNSGSQSGRYANMTASGAGISGEANAFVVDYGNKGMIKGHGRCSTRAGANMTWTSTYNVIQDNFVTDLTNQTGQSGAQYCYCHLDSYTPLNDTAIALSGPWVFYDGSGDAGNCADRCAKNCVSNLHSGASTLLAFRAAVFDSIESSPAMCEANVITINWSNADAADISANNAGTATYDSDIRTPVKAQTIKGKTFRGWRFSKPEQTNLP